MKPAFFNISETKQKTVIDSCVKEVAQYGYEKSSTDRIIKKAGISKGGLYEYISSKKELFLFTVEHVYRKLYDYIRNQIDRKEEELPGDILLRFSTVSSIAIDFYLDHPEYIRFISSTYRQHDPELEKAVRDIFLRQFMDIFGGIEKVSLKYDRDRLIELLIWLLAKTRDDFLHDINKGGGVKKIKNAYLKNWDFYLSVLRTGIYSK